MTEYAQRLLRMIEKIEERLVQLRSKKASYVPALIAEAENELATLREELFREIAAKKETA